MDSTGSPQVELRICHLYGDLMNIYGDDGNITALAKRAAWRGIKPKIIVVTIGDKIDPDFADIYFFGGGQDQQQVAVSTDLKKVNGARLKQAVDRGAIVFSVCGGYQLLGHYYQPKSGPKLPGVGLIDAYTVAGDTRMIGNEIIELNSEISGISRRKSSKLIGFENHSGKTFLGDKAKPLGKVLVGSGNNGKDKAEGAFSGRVFGCYLHGSCLPKNPHFADFLIEKALERRYGQVKLKKLDDSVEWEAHQSILKKLGIVPPSFHSGAQ